MNRDKKDRDRKRNESDSPTAVRVRTFPTDAVGSTMAGERCGVSWYGLLLLDWLTSRSMLQLKTKSPMNQTVLLEPGNSDGENNQMTQIRTGRTGFYAFSHKEEKTVPNCSHKTLMSAFAAMFVSQTNAGVFKSK